MPQLTPRLIAELHLTPIDGTVVSAIVQAEFVWKIVDL